MIVYLHKSDYDIDTNIAGILQWQDRILGPCFSNIPVFFVLFLSTYLFKLGTFSYDGSWIFTDGKQNAQASTFLN